MMKHLGSNFNPKIEWAGITLVPTKAVQLDVHATFITTQLLL